MRWIFMKIEAIDKPVIHHLTKTIRQNFVRDTIQITLKLIEPPRAKLEIP